MFAVAVPCCQDRSGRLQRLPFVGFYLIGDVFFQEIEDVRRRFSGGPALKKRTHGVILPVILFMPPGHPLHNVARVLARNYRFRAALVWLQSLQKVFARHRVAVLLMGMFIPSTFAVPVNATVTGCRSFARMNCASV